VSPLPGPSRAPADFLPALLLAPENTDDAVADEGERRFVRAVAHWRNCVPRCELAFLVDGCDVLGDVLRRGLVKLREAR
jgi:hypothetical protein